MKLIGHIIKKDIARDRWALLVWALLFIAQVGVGVTLIHVDGNDRDWPMELQMASVALVFLQVAMGYILVARLVQADALIGTDMFWLTRPVSAARLLVAKVLGALLIFAVLPVLLLLPWWLYCHLEWPELCRIAFETLAWQLLMIGPAFLVASLTDDLGRVLLWTLLLVIGLMSWVALMQLSFIGRAFNTQSGAWLAFTRLWLSAIVLVGGSLLIVAHQYLTRRIGRSILLTVLCLGLIAGIGRFWPWSFAQSIGSFGRTSRSVSADGAMRQLDLQVGATRVSNYPLTKGSLTQPTIEVRLRASDSGLALPEGAGAFTLSVEHRWQWPDSPPLTYFGGQGWGYFPVEAVLRKRFGLPRPPQDPETDEWVRARNAEVKAKLAAHGIVPAYDNSMLTPEDRRAMAAFVSVPKSVIARIRQQPAAYSATVRGYVTVPKIAVDLPLAAGAWGAGDSQTFRMTQLLPMSTKHTDPEQGRVVLLVNTVPADQSNSGLSILTVRARPQAYFRSQYQSVNHADGVMGWVPDGRRGLGLAQVGGVVINWLSLNVYAGKVIRNGTWVAQDPEWLAHTTLVLVTEQEVAEFTGSAKVDRFELPVSALERREATAEDEAARAKP